MAEPVSTLPVRALKEVETKSPSVDRGISRRLLALTAIFIVVATATLYTPALMRYRYLQIEAALKTAHIAAVAGQGAIESPLDAGEQIRILNLLGMQREIGRAHV